MLIRKRRTSILGLLYLIVVDLSVTDTEIFLQAIYDELPDNYIMYPVSVEMDSLTDTSAPIIDMNITFNYDFITDSGNTNDNAPDSVRPNLYSVKDSGPRES